MNKFLRISALIAFIFFEVYAGVRLFSDPVSFTNNVIVIFGYIMLIVGIISVIRAFSAQRKRLPYKLTLAGGVIDLIIGAACAFFSYSIVAFFPVLVKIYGVIMIIMGISKIRQYNSIRYMRVNRAWLLLLSAILTILLGIFVFFYPYTTTDMIWTYAGISLIVEGAVDLLTLILSFFLG